MAVGPFLDTSVLLAGLIDLGPQSAPAQSVLHAVAEKIAKDPATAWHCCLEFFSVSTRLPAEYRLTPVDASAPARSRDLRADRSARPARGRIGCRCCAAASRDLTIGGRIYDAHIAEVARAAGARVVVTDNRRHFLAALRHGIRVETPTEFLASLKKA